jgi:hypothetical protein
MFSKPTTAYRRFSSTGFSANGSHPQRIDPGKYKISDKENEM